LLRLSDDPGVYLSIGKPKLLRSPAPGQPIGLEQRNRLGRIETFSVKRFIRQLCQKRGEWDVGRNHSAACPMLLAKPPPRLNFLA